MNDNNDKSEASKTEERLKNIINAVLMTTKIIVDGDDDNNTKMLKLSDVMEYAVRDMMRATAMALIVGDEDARSLILVDLGVWEAKERQESLDKLKSFIEPLAKVAAE
jgi:C4-type Zn-finger protein